MSNNYYYNYMAQIQCDHLMPGHTHGLDFQHLKALGRNNLAEVRVSVSRQWRDRNTYEHHQRVIQS